MSLQASTVKAMQMKRAKISSVDLVNNWEFCDNCNDNGNRNNNNNTYEKDIDLVNNEKF